MPMAPVPAKRSMKSESAMVGAEDVEKSFAQAIAGGADFEIPRRFQNTAAIFSCDDAHVETFENGYVYPTDASW